MNKAKTLIATAITVVGLSAIGTGVYAAQTQTMPKPMSNLVSAIAKKFNLNETDVQKVFDEQRQAQEQQRQAEQAQRQKEMLDQAVTNGKITQAQEDLIIAKQAEMKAFAESLKDKSESERQTAMKAQMDSLKQWATDNKIPEQFAFFGRGGMGGGRGEGMGPRMGGDMGFKMGFMMGKASTK